MVYHYKLERKIGNIEADKMKAAVQLIVGRWSIRCFANELGIKYRTFRCYAEKASNIDCIDNMNFTPKQCLLWGI